jgi:uncharacterized cupin superfamily protein
MLTWPPWTICESLDRAAELVGCSLWEAPPGEAAFPYHYHFGDEELVIVIRRRPTLRTAEGIRELDEGEVLRFPLGEDGAHQILNRTEDAVTFLAVSSHGRPDIVVYPDSNKLGVGRASATWRGSARLLSPRARR